MSQYIYHLKPNPFVGDSLIPLNTLDKASSAYEEHSKKYQDRKAITQATIPHLDCLWNDVIHFSTINPQIVVDEILKVEKDLHVLRPTFLRININKIIGKFPAVYFSRNHDKPKGNYTLTKDEVIRLEDIEYQELSAVPEKTIEYWKLAKRSGQKLLWFAFVPHVFVKAEMPLSMFDELQLIR